MRELRLWIYSGHVLGQRRVLLVADTSVGGAKDRFSGSYGNPSTKNSIPASAKGFPDWIQGPGTWVSLVPLPEGTDFKGLDRYSQDFKPQSPGWLPSYEEAYVPGEKIRDAIEDLGEKVANVLREKFPAQALKTA